MAKNGQRNQRAGQENRRVETKMVELNRALIVLAGGFSKRFGQDKCLISLAGRPLVRHVLDRASSVVDEKVVVVSPSGKTQTLSRVFKPGTRVVMDKYEGQSPLVGALTGFESVDAEYSLLLPCDVPFVSSEVAELLLDLCVNKGAAIPRWPNGYIEPLQAAYNTRLAIEAAKKALDEAKRDLSSMISHLQDVRYVSTLVIEQLDPKLLTFFNVNTPQDLKRAEFLVKKRWC